MFALQEGMGDARDNDAYEEELLDYEEEDDKAPDSVNAKANGEAAKRFGFFFSSFRVLGFYFFLFGSVLVRLVLLLLLVEWWWWY